METATAMANEVLTMAEIEDRFDAEWVLLAEPETDEQLNVLSGKVILHHPERDVFDQETLKISPFPYESAIFYVGQMEGHFALNL